MTGLDKIFTSVNQPTENLLLYLVQEGEKEQRANERVCQSQTGNCFSPFGRLGKHGNTQEESGRPDNPEVEQSHPRDRPLPGRFYISINRASTCFDCNP
jgi:hypothetical protein